MTLERFGLAQYVARQLSTFYPDREIAAQELVESVNGAVVRHAGCFAAVRIKGASQGVDHLHTDQYAAFLYFLANTLFLRGERELASKVYALNKALHCVDIFYEVALPKIFALQHPVGTVVGRGNFSDYLFVYQRCSVGSNLDGVYPRLGEGIVMFGGSAVIGNCTIGSNSWLSVDTVVMDEDVPGNCVVFGRSPNLVIRPTKRDVKREIFKIMREQHEQAIR